MTDESVAKYLHSLATHFDRKDWEWTRKHDIKHIRREGDYSGYDHPVRRVQRLIKRHLPGNAWRRDRGIWGMLSGTEEKTSFWKKIQLKVWGLKAEVYVTLRTDKHLPDGVLENAAIIAYWEEDGEYLQMVQPSVGELLANFLLEDPEHPHAQKILAELTRLSERYSARIKAGEVDGEVHED